MTRTRLRITPTVSFSPGGLLNGSAAVGYRRFNGRSAELPDFSGLVAVVNVSATIVGRHRLDTSFARDLRYSYEDVTPYYLSTGGTVTLTTQVSEPFDVRVTGTLQSLDYSRIERRPDGRYLHVLWWRRGVPDPPDAPRRHQRRVVAPRLRSARARVQEQSDLRDLHVGNGTMIMILLLLLAGSGQTQASSTRRPASRRGSRPPTTSSALKTC